MIYVDVKNIDDFKCYSVVDKDTIRAYYSTPALNSSSEYVDFYINSHYLQKSGYQSWGNYNNLPVCIQSDKLTTDFYYRNDLPDILFILIVFLFIIVFLPYKIVFRSFGRWSNV